MKISDSCFSGKFLFGEKFYSGRDSVSRKTSVLLKVWDLMEISGGMKTDLVREILFLRKSLI
jgi:hypothetical protein